MICNKKQINLSLSLLSLLFRTTPTIPCVLVAFSVFKVSIHDLHAVAIAEMYYPIPFRISLPDSMMSSRDFPRNNKVWAHVTEI